jgi:hypothetical protein
MFDGNYKQSVYLVKKAVNKIRVAVKEQPPPTPRHPKKGC